MQVKLNAFRGDDRPGDIVDIPDSDAATLIAHGAAFPADDIDAELDAAEKSGAQVVSGSAALAATSGTDTEKP